MSGQRRSQGEGSIHRTERGGWRAVYELPRGPDGKRRRKKRRAATRAEAQRLLREMRDEYESTGRMVDRQRLITTTMDDYLGSRRADGLTKSSIDREARFCAMISDYFGMRPTSSLSVEDCDRLLLDVSLGLPDQAGRPTRPLVGRDHLRRIRSTLRRALRNDVRLGLINSNVADLAELPADTGTRHRQRALTVSELSDLLDAAEGTVAVLIDLIGRHGLRPAEARALTWDCVDLDAATLKVKAQIGSTNQFAPPKTQRALRTIRLHRGAVEQIRQAGKHEADKRQAAGPAWVDLSLVASSDNGTPVDRNNFARSLRQVCELAGVSPSVTPYELRHTAITHQCERGFHAWQVADWAGTSEKMIYMHYRHLLTEVIDLPPVDTPSHS